MNRELLRFILAAAAAFLLAAYGAMADFIYG